MSRRSPRLELTAVLAAVGHVDGDEMEERVLDATEDLLRSSGLRRWSVEDVAERAGAGRTSVYRRFDGRDGLIHAVLARELRTTLAAMSRAAADAADLESQAVAGVVVALQELEGSVVDSLLRSDPATFLPFLTTDAGPLLAIARGAITAHVSSMAPAPSAELAEAAARFGLSFILTRETVLPVDDPVALDEAVRRMIRPFLVAFGVAAPG